MNPGVFIDSEFQVPALNQTGPLQNFKFTVKDLFALEGRCTTAGNPLWGALHADNAEHAPIVTTLLEAGASVSGVSNLDEFAFSLIGENVHHGAPKNPKFPKYFAGGSSGGSAAAVAAKWCDFSLGTDTAGSIRIPANNCSVFGLRAGVNSLNTKGILPLSESFDVPGWFARSGEVLDRVTSVLFNSSQAKGGVHNVIYDERAFEKLPHIQRDGFVKPVHLVAEHFETKVETWTSNPFRQKEVFDLFVTIELYEAWEVYGDWVRTQSDSISTDVRNRLRKGSLISGKDYEHSKTKLDKLKSDLQSELKDSVLVRPTSICPPLLRNANEAQKAAYRAKTIGHTALISALGWAEVIIPLSADDTGLPQALSIASPAGTERLLSNLARCIGSDCIDAISSNEMEALA